MSGVGEAALCEILAQIMFKSLKIVWTIVQDARNIGSDRAKFDLRLKAQIARMDGVRKILQDRRIGDHIEARDRHTYFNVMQEMYHALTTYVLKTTPSQQSAKQLLLENSAQDLFVEYERRDSESLSNPSRAQESFWLKTREKVTWAVYKKNHLEKLVVEVEEWGHTLESLTSTILPLICLRQNFSAATIREIRPSSDAELDDLNVKSDILIEQRMELENDDSTMPGLEFERSNSQSLFIDPSQLTFLCPDFPRELKRGVILKDGDEKDPSRTDLGGRSRRQWANLRQGDGTIRRVIVEFKDRPLNPPHDATKQATKELNSLVRELRIAAQKETMQVFYCHGYYDCAEHYGIVYGLPPSVDMNTMQCESLGSILLKPEYNRILAANLRNRIQLAEAIATTLLNLHSVQWVHKSLNPDNVLLFGRRNSDGSIDFDWSRPYLVGFDASRSNFGVTDKRSPNLFWENRVYTHPERQSEEHNRYKKMHDIYSLGVMLLELGMMDCFKHSRYRKNQKEWTNLGKEMLLQKFVTTAKSMKGVIGPLYEEIVLTCLLGSFGVSEENEDVNETLLMGAFRSEVCEKLDQIRV